MYTSSKRFAVLLAALALVVAACGDAVTDSETTDMDEMSLEHAFGEPADPADADRVIEIIAADDLTFTPDEVTVSPGEVITFRVVNDGQVVHDFTLGDEATQEEHRQAMAEMAGMVHDDPNAIGLAAGETKELTWRFADGGSVIIGCNQPGHYEGGMRGQVTVES